MNSFIEFKNEKPYISVGGDLHYPLAYTTYFEERGGVAIGFLSGLAFRYGAKM